MVTTGGLSLDQAPPIHLPLRFFLTAPWLAVGAGLVSVLQGEMVMASRWTPAALAATHLIAIGFLGQIMCGALLQMLPVITGTPVPRVGQVAPLIHLLLSLGSVLMAAGFLGAGAALLGIGAVATSLGFAVFLGAAAFVLGRAQGPAASRLALRLAALSLAFTVALGLLLTAGLLGWLSLPRFPDWVQAHLSWGLLGWVGLLIVGLGFQVVPLFHVTPHYPGWMTRVLVPAVFLALVVATILLLTGQGSKDEWPYSALALGYCAFGAITIGLQLRRARPRLDATLIHWWLSMGAVMAAACARWLEAPPELLGILLLVGVGVGLPSGMLLKIVPFLCWFHLQSRQVAAGRFEVRVPHTHLLIPERVARWHPLLHGLSLALLAAAVHEPVLARLGGLLLACSALWLFALIAGAAWRYRRVSLALR
jgi:hypothetical protein